MTRLNLRFAVIMMIYGGAVFLVYRDEVLGPLLAPLAVLTARMTAGALGLIGMDALRDQAVLAHPDGFAYEIAYTCTGFLPAVTFIACILASSGTTGRKWVGIAWGVPLLIAVNLLRLTHLFYLGVNFPGAFGFAHEVLWEGLLAVSFIGLWLGWLHWSSKEASVSLPGSTNLGGSAEDFRCGVKQRFSRFQRGKRPASSPRVGQTLSR